MEKLTARDFAALPDVKIPEVTLQRWARLEGAVEGWAEKRAGSWWATEDDWRKAAAKDRKTGPKGPRKKAADTAE